VNEGFGTKLVYNSVSFEDYLAERKAELGEFMGTLIAGIYQGIAEGANEVSSDFEKAAGRPHKSPQAMIVTFKNR
jgi:NAD(P)H dehydrogenase (quinone)